MKAIVIPVAIALLLGGGLGALLGYLGKCRTGACPLTANPQRGALFGAVFAKVNVDALPDLAGQFQIKGIPAVLLYVNGHEVTRIVGYNPKDVYVRQLEQLI